MLSWTSECEISIEMTGKSFEDGIDRRVQVLEKIFEKIDSKLDMLIAASHDTDTRLARIETSLDAKASAVEMSEVRGSMRSLPTVWQLITLVFGILAGAFAIARFGLPHP